MIFLVSSLLTFAPPCVFLISVNGSVAIQLPHKGHITRGWERMRTLIFEKRAQPHITTWGSDCTDSRMSASHRQYACGLGRAFSLSEVWPSFVTTLGESLECNVKRERIFKGGGPVKPQSVLWRLSFLWPSQERLQTLALHPEVHSPLGCVCEIKVALFHLVFNQRKENFILERWSGVMFSKRRWD